MVLKSSLLNKFFSELFIMEGSEVMDEVGVEEGEGGVSKFQNRIVLSDEHVTKVPGGKAALSLDFFVGTT
jgi:hypothetical protein